MIAIENELDQKTRSDGDVRISLKKLPDSTIQIDYTQKVESEGGNLFIGNDILISQTICKSLGQSKIRIKAGDYKKDRSKNSLGTVLVKAILE